MEYLHTMVRVHNLDESLDFYCNKLGLKEISRKKNEKGRFTLVFLTAGADETTAKQTQAPMLELTYNWPDADGNVEQGRVIAEHFRGLGWSVGSCRDSGH